MTARQNANKRSAVKRQMSHRERIDVEGIVLLVLLFVALCAFWGLVLYVVLRPML